MEKLAERLSRVPRNIRGGFLCGFVGILSFWIVYPHSPVISYVALIACSFTATVVGFWLEETVLLFRKRFVQLMALRSLPQDIRVAVGNKCRCAISSIQRKCDAVAGFFVGHYNTVAGIPPWFRKDRWRIASLMAFCAVLANFAIHAAWMWLIYRSHSEWFSSAGKSDSHAFILFGIFAGCCLIFSAPFFKFGAEKDRSEQTRRIEFRKQLYRVGPTRFFGRKLLELFAAQLIVISGTLVGLSVCAVFGALSLSFVIIPLAIAILPLRGIFRLATRPNHWPTFAVGICSLFTSIWIFQPQFADFRYVIFIALGTGLVAGGAVYGLSKAVEMLFATQPRLHRFTSRKFKTRITWLGGAFDWLAELIVGSIPHWCIPARVFNY